MDRKLDYFCTQNEVWCGRVWERIAFKVLFVLLTVPAQAISSAFSNSRDMLRLQRASTSFVRLGCKSYCRQCLTGALGVRHFGVTTFVPDQRLTHLDSLIRENSERNVNDPKLLRDDLFGTFSERCKEVLTCEYEHEMSVAENRLKTWPASK